jgi:hypothetical protein
MKQSSKERLNAKFPPGMYDLFNADDQRSVAREFMTIVECKRRNRKLAESRSLLRWIPVDNGCSN